MEFESILNINHYSGRASRSKYQAITYDVCTPLFRPEKYWLIWSLDKIYQSIGQPSCSISIIQLPRSFFAGINEMELFLKENRKKLKKNSRLKEEIKLKMQHPFYSLKNRWRNQYVTSYLCCWCGIIL